MESLFAVVLLALVFLFYFSNRNNHVNRWCAKAGFIFWLGVAKEAILFSAIPQLEARFSITLVKGFMPIYSSCTWALYTLAMPTAVIYALCFCGINERYPIAMKWIKPLLYMPGLLLSLHFTPFAFRHFQLTNLLFWIVYSIYNMLFVAAYTALFVVGVRKELDPQAKGQKKLVSFISVPPVLYWCLTVFPIHALQIQPLFKLWQGNAVVLLICLVAFIQLSFKYGFMGLRLTKENYHWNSQMEIANRGAAYMAHMLKGQTTKMEWCLYNLEQEYEQQNKASPREIEIMSQSIHTMKSFMEKLQWYSQGIQMEESRCSLSDMLKQAMPLGFEKAGNVRFDMDVSESISWLCDREHMTEVFTNILENSLEAVGEGGTIAASAKGNTMQICDDGKGMELDQKSNAFAPYFTTKNGENNFGLGLAYCKNVIDAHGGKISISSEPGIGTTITIQLPTAKVSFIPTEVIHDKKSACAVD